VNGARVRQLVSMTKPILVAVDPFREDPDPLSFAALICELTGQRPVVVGVYPDADPEPLHALALDELEWARERLPGGAELLAVPGDSRRRALLEAAEMVDAGLLVLGSVRHGPVGHILTGSLTEHLLLGAPCPVAIVPRGYDAPAEGLRRIGAAFVDTPEGSAALAGGIALARRSGASLRAITVVRPLGWGVTAVPMTTSMAREQREIRRAAEEALTHALAGLEPALAAEPVVIEDGVAATLARLSSELDLLICGSHGYGPVKTVLHGSVSHALSRHSRCPLIVVPPGSERALEELATHAAAGRG
jgi:nucleotide-binding universal stress UspA family protein